MAVPNLPRPECRAPFPARFVSQFDQSPPLPLGAEGASRPFPGSSFRNPAPLCFRRPKARKLRDCLVFRATNPQACTIITAENYGCTEFAPSGMLSPVPRAVRFAIRPVTTASARRRRCLSLFPASSFRNPAPLWFPASESAQTSGLPCFPRHQSSGLHHHHRGKLWLYRICPVRNAEPRTRSVSTSDTKGLSPAEGRASSSGFVP